MEHTIINKDKIAYQGQEGAYSHMACLDAFPEMEPFACDSFEEVFDVTTSGFTKAALIPVENSQAGRVADIHNLLPNSTSNPPVLLPNGAVVADVIGVVNVVLPET